MRTITIFVDQGEPFASMDDKRQSLRFLGGHFHRDPLPVIPVRGPWSTGLVATLQHHQDGNLAILSVQPGSNLTLTFNGARSETVRIFLGKNNPYRVKKLVTDAGATDFLPQPKPKVPPVSQPKAEAVPATPPQSAKPVHPLPAVAQAPAAKSPPATAKPKPTPPPKPKVPVTVDLKSNGNRILLAAIGGREGGIGDQLRATQEVGSSVEIPVLGQRAARVVRESDPSEHQRAYTIMPLPDYQLSVRGSAATAASVVVNQAGRVISLDSKT